jgi:hypothetical protein
MRFPFRRHAITERGWSLRAHQVNVERATVNVQRPTQNYTGGIWLQPVSATAPLHT